MASRQRPGFLPPRRPVVARPTPSGLSRRRLVLAAVAAVVTLTVLTWLLGTHRDQVSLAIVFMLYLAAVVALAAAGGPVVGIAAAVAAFLLVNFFFTEPFHTFKVDDPEQLLELFIFLAVSGTVAALVHTATRRQDMIEVTTAEAQELAAANDLRTALLRAVSHDLRTPLATAKLATSSLLASDVEHDDDQRRELLGLADREIDRLVGIVENLLDAGRLQAGVLNVDVNATPVSVVVESVAHTIPEADRGRVVRAIGEVPPVNADAALLERVLANLVTNALRADPDHTISITAGEHADGRVAIDVVDHGPGLTDAQLHAAFRPFHRLEDAGTAAGVGLGLPICAGFCEAMGADLVFAATPGGGLTARVILEGAA